MKVRTIGTKRARMMVFEPCLAKKVRPLFTFFRVEEAALLA
jgi:hypothetical protein